MKKSYTLLIILLITMVVSAGTMSALAKTATRKPQKKETSNIQKYGYHRGHKWVDMGLPSGLKWATYNVGSARPEGTGSYFAWGETAPKSQYDIRSAKMHDVQIDAISGDSIYDAATASWGQGWRTPTLDEWSELCENSTSKVVELNGKVVIELTSKINGNKIYMPPTGYMDDDFGDMGGVSYWTATPYAEDADFSMDIYWSDGWKYGEPLSRSCGMNIRPVMASVKNEAVVTKKTSNKSKQITKGSSSQTDIAEIAPQSTTEALDSVYFEVLSDTIIENETPNVLAVNTFEEETPISSANINAEVETYTDFTADAQSSEYPTQISDTIIAIIENNDVEISEALSTKQTDADVDAANDSIYINPVTNTTPRSSKEKTAKTNTSNKKKSNRINGHEYIDLGYKTMWAQCNIGAKSPEDFGYYFAWGETRPKSKYTAENSDCNEKKIDQISGKLKLDAAKSMWGGKWRMPTVEDIQELCSHCAWSKTEIEGIPCIEFKSNINGNSLYLPLGGECHEENIYGIEVYGAYWTGTPHESLLDKSYNLKIEFNVDDNQPKLGELFNSRIYGLMIRPVIDRR